MALSYCISSGLYKRSIFQSFVSLLLLLLLLLLLCVCFQPGKAKHVARTFADEVAMDSAELEAEMVDKGGKKG